jgi:hypothetical protein
MPRLEQRELEQITAQVSAIVLRAATKIYEQHGYVPLILGHILSRLRWRQNDDGAVVAEPVDRDGNVVITNRLGSTDPMSLEELIGEIEAAHAFAFGMCNAPADQRPVSQQTPDARMPGVLSPLERLQKARQQQAKSCPCPQGGVESPSDADPVERMKAARRAESEQSNEGAGS